MNKETLQLYNNRLEKNNVSLQDVLDEVNALSDAPIEKLYLIRNGIEQTDVTGGHKFIEITSDTNNSNYAEVQKDGWIELCGKQWGAYGWITNNSFDFTKYVKIYVEYDFPNAPPDTAYLEFSQSHIAIMTSEDLAGAIYDSGSILPARVLTVPRKIVRCDVNVNQTSNRWCISVANITSRTDYKNYPLRIYNVWFETDGGILEEPELQNKTITPSETQQVVTPDSEFDGLSNVIVEPIPDEYIVPNLQDKSITIIENGTQIVTPDEGYSGLNSVEVITNIGGEEQQPIYEFYDAYCKLYDSLVPEYNKKYDTDEAVTVYTPAEGYNSYFIIHRSNGFQVIWSKDNRPVGYFDSSKFWPLAVFYIPQISLYSNGVKQSKTSSASSMVTINTSNSGISFYYSSAYNTVEECIAVLKGEATTYTLTSSQNFSSLKYGDTATCVVMTNSIELGPGKRINECGRQLSSNETIIVIPTE